MTDDTAHISYRFRLADGRCEQFDFRFARESFEVIMDSSAPPEWATLGFHQCPHCTLSLEDHVCCPLALSIVEVVRRFDDLNSHAETSLDVVTDERTFSGATSVQSGMSSLMGLLMAASGCPHMAPFRPMARFHLPFATTEETTYRAISMYVTALYMKERAAAGHSLEGLNEIYRRAHIVNSSVAERLRAHAQTDSSVNAVVVLDMFATGIPYFMNDSLKDLKGLFFAYAN
ncbi:MAG: DUF6901 family protein [Planctomycetota bacterium]